MWPSNLYGSPHQGLSPSVDFGKPHVLLLAHPQKSLPHTSSTNKFSLLKQAKREVRRKSPSMLFASTSLYRRGSSPTYPADISQPTASYVKCLHSLPSKLSCAMTTISKFRNVVNRCYAETVSALDGVENALRSFHLTTTALQQQGEEDRTVWQLMAKPQPPKRMGLHPKCDPPCRSHFPPRNTQSYQPMRLLQERNAHTLPMPIPTS